MMFFSTNRSRKCRFLRSRLPALLVAVAGLRLCFPSVHATSADLPAHLLQGLSTPSKVSGPIDLEIAFRGKSLAVHLEPTVVRTESFQVLTVAGGIKRALKAPAPRTYLGSVAGHPGSEVRLARIQSGWQGRVDLGTEVFYVEPVDRNEKAAESSAHWVYTRGEIPEEPFTCLVGDEQRLDVEGNLYDQEVETEPKQAPPAGSFAIAEISIDMDYEFYLLAGGTPEAAVAEVESILLAVNAAYERDVQISHRMVALIVRDTPSDPYNSSDGLTLLSEVEREWKANHADVPCDVVHLFTGKSLNGGNAGFGYIGVICNDGSKFGFSKQTNTSFSVRIAVACHELGHNWNADHCNDMGGINFFPTCCDQPSFNMCSSIRGDPRESFCPPVQRVIRAHRDSRPCLEIGTPPPSPTPTQAADTPTLTPTPPAPTETPTPEEGQTATPSPTPDLTEGPTPTQPSFDPDFNSDGEVDALDLLVGLQRGSLSMTRLFEFAMFWHRSLAR